LFVSGRGEGGEDGGFGDWLLDFCFWLGFGFFFFG
jgi:hypothetical protein